MFYDKFKFLCDSVGKSCNKVALEIGLSNATPTKWKKTGATPDSSTLAKVSTYFQIPVAFFMSTPPFDCWELINQNRKGFLYYTGLDSAKLRLLWGIDDQSPDETPVRDFITFLSQAVESARPTEEGDWEITLKPAYQKNEKTPTSEDGSEEQQLDYGFFRVMKNAKERGFSPEDIELALDFLKRARGRDQQ